MSYYPRSCSVRPERLALSALCILLLALLGGCSTTTYTPYAPHTAQQASAVQSGTIRHVSETVIDETTEGMGSWSGAGLGAAAGTITTLSPWGLVGGGALGALLADNSVRTTQRRLLAITVDMDNGSTVTIAQEENDVYLPGDRVRLVYSADGRTRLQLY